MLQSSKKITDDIVAQVSEKDADFKNVLLPMAYDENNQGLEAHILGFYQSVSTSQELRDASTEAEKLMDDFSIEASMREDVFKVSLFYSMFPKQTSQQHVLFHLEQTNPSTRCYGSRPYVAPLENRLDELIESKC